MTNIDDLGIVWKKGVLPEDSPQGWAFVNGPYTNFGYREWHEQGMHIQKDVAIPTRHGTLYADLFRPDGLGPDVTLPTVMAMSPYGKHARPQLPLGIDPGLLSHYSISEAPDPGHWTRYGYAVAYVDTVGAFHSEGTYVSFGTVEAEAGADVVDWLGSREWSNGAVALSGASYYSMISYRIAAQRPAHLKAIMPWEGGMRWYDGFTHHGGIPSSATGFVGTWSGKSAFVGCGLMEDHVATALEHPDFDEYWADKVPDFSKITVPVFTSAGWMAGAEGGHLAGTVDAWRAVASEHKWFIGWPYGHQFKWYLPEMLELQRQFLDHFLKGEGELPDWPPVQIGSRVSLDEELPLRPEQDFPLPDTRYVTAYLDAATSRLGWNLSSETTTAVYDASERNAAARFDLFFDEETELTGFMRLHLWVQIGEGDEADLFVQLQKLDESGEPMGLGPLPEVFRAAGSFGSARVVGGVDPADFPITRGWLRASYRELDPNRASEFQPAHSYRRREPLTPGEPVAVDVEIWPTSVTFRAGEGLRLLISGKDIAGPLAPLSHDDANAGTHTILGGGDKDSYLVLPLIPTRGAHTGQS